MADWEGERISGMTGPRNMTGWWEKGEEGTAGKEGMRFVGIL